MLSSCQVGNTDKAPVREKKVQIKDASGFHIQLEELSFNEIDLRWGHYTNPADKVVSFLPAKKAIVSHFRLKDDTLGNSPAIPEKQFVVYRESPEAYEMKVTATGRNNRSFFELIMPDDFFQHFLTEDSPFLNSFHRDEAINTPSPAFTAQMMPGMPGIINELLQAPYSGHLKAVYLEAKVIELFLMQVKQLDQQHLPKQTKLQPTDIERLHAIKQYIAQHYEQSLSITELARKAGINQTKLKSGFKELFNTTVFGYLGDLRMQEAKRLLLDEKMYVSEVADRIGYKYPHHFTAAFRKKFGMMPRDIRK